MPKTTTKGTPKQSELPGTIKRSDAKAQRTFAKAHDAAARQYGEGRRAHQTALAALKTTHEKVGDHWEKKARNGPSDEQAKGGKNTNRPTKGGVDANASKEHLLGVAKRLDIRGRSAMKKKELVDAIQKANTRATAKTTAKTAAKPTAKTTAKPAKTAAKPTARTAARTSPKATAKNTAKATAKPRKKATAKA